MIIFKDIMNMNSSVVLLDLLRIALGNSAEWKGEGSVDWKEVIGMARKQGVLAIAFDALEKVPTELRPSKNILLEWFGRVKSFLLPDFILSICSDTWLLITLRKRRR